LSGNLRHRETVGPDGGGCQCNRRTLLLLLFIIIIIIIIIFSPVTQFPGNEKNYAMQYKKVQKKAGMNLTPPPPSQELLLLLLLLLQRGVVVYRFFGGFIARRDVAAVVSAIAVQRVRVWTSSSPRSPVLH